MATTASFKQQCPSCEAWVPIRDPKLIGRKIDCPKCKYRFVVEEPSPEEDDGDAADTVQRKGKPAKKKAAAKKKPAKKAAKKKAAKKKAPARKKSSRTRSRSRRGKSASRKSSSKKKSSKKGGRRR